jgi:hypothetical protein
MAEEWLPPQEVVRREMNTLRGRMLSTIEAVGLPRTQEEAIKHLTKNITFQQQYLLEEIVNTMNEGRNFKFKYGSRYEYDNNDS